MHFSRYLFFFLCCAGTGFRADCSQQNPASPPSLGLIRNVTVSPQPNGIEIEISATRPFAPQGVRLTSPDRLVFDFPGYALSGSSRRLAVDRGPVKAVRVSLFQADPPITRVVVDSTEPLRFELKPKEDRIVIYIPFSDSAPPPPTHPAEPERPSTAPILQNQQPHGGIPRSSGSRVTAYTLQAQAKDLKLEELQALEEKAEAGDPQAETTLALAYHDAVLLRRDEKKALLLLHKAADQGFMAAEEALGIFAQGGIGISQPAPQEALDWYKEAVDLGSLDAATNIALMYAGGIGVPKDPAQALTWFQRAAAGGDATAQYNLALIYAQGKGVPKDYKESVHWLTLAAEQNVLPAIMNLARFYLRPPEGESSNLDRAIHYYEKAAELGSVSAEAILGNIFASGAQGKPDYEQAVKWYRKAADHGQPDAEFGLGARYELGQGVPLDLQEARRLFTAAADKGLPDAQYELGTMWEDGKGDSADATMAVHYFQLAAEQGHTKAQFRLGRLLANNNRSRTDRVSAYKWLLLAQSVPESATVLADLRKSMTAEEVVEAETAVDQWRISHRRAGE